MSGQGGIRLLVVVAVGALVAGGCVGARTTSDLDQLVRSRGGGISQGLVTDAIDAVADAQDAAPVALLRVIAMSNRVTLEARVPGDPQEYDIYTYGTSGLHGGNGLSGPQPGSRSAGSVPIEAQVFDTGDFALDRLNDMIDQAIADAGFDDAYVEHLLIGRPATGGDVVVTVRVTNDRRTTDVEFAADGSLVAVEPV